LTPGVRADSFAGMFHIMGGDGKEYGPVTVDQIRVWIAAGRANLDTQAKALGSEEWRRLADFAEFSSPDGAPPVIDAPVAETTDLASHGARTGAALINAVIYVLATAPGFVFTSALLLKQNPHLTQGGFIRPTDLNLAGIEDGMVWVKVGLGLAMFVQILLIALRGQNIGKLIVGARVVRAADGLPAGLLPAALLRYVIPVVLLFLLNGLFPFSGFLFLVVDYGFMFRRDRRCLHDLIAGTKVVKA
jgi:uncharacterized RDD family membrane protein YckC